jgi:hypothetical protein
MSDAVLPGAANGKDDAATPRTPVGTDFKAVAIGAGANLEALPAYFTDPLLATGNMPGIAISAFNNRALRQGTFVASSLCLWISDQTQQYVPDDGDQIHWMSEWQNALADFVLALIPPGPNLGAYLPLAGGTMVGNINFQTGISTILSNNTWYFAQDSGGQARGLIIKNSNNDMTINDGSSTHVVIAGQPSTNNNFAWSGRDTTGIYRALIGVLSDNAIHIGSSATSELYFDITGSVHHASNVIIGNNHYFYGNDSGGTPRAMLGIATNNSLSLGIGATSATDIYSGGGQPIYFHSTANALGQLTVNGYSYLNGGARAYIPGGNDPFQIYADHGFYARLHFYAAGTRDWSCGALNSGPFAIADESAGAIRWQIDLGGNVTVYNSEVINNYLTIYGGMNVAGGNFNCGTAYINGNLNGNNAYLQAGYFYNTLSCWNGFWVNSGNINAGGATVYCAAVSTGGTVQGGWLYSTGDGQINGAFHVNSTISANNIDSVNYIRDNGDLSVGGNAYIGGGQTTVQGHLSVNYGFCLGGNNFNFDYTVSMPYGNHTQWAGGLGVYAQFFSSYSDATLKRNVVPVERDALAAIRPLRFFSYDSPRTIPGGEEVIDARSHVALGFLAQQVAESLSDAVIETDQPTIFHEEHKATGEVDCGFETRPVLAIDMMTMLAYSLRAIQQLAERVEQLEGR